MSVDHYENFPVASWLCPPNLRPAVAAIYWFARTADDLADEGDAAADARLADLEAFRSDLRAVSAGNSASARWPQVFGPLAAAMRRYQLPATLLHDLLDAFAQDVVKTHYADRAELLDYCRRSANPVGRLLLHLYGVHDEDAKRLSDAICSALQLINFWQDVAVDARKGRIYLPLSDCEQHRVDPASVLSLSDTPTARELIRAECDWARELMSSGVPLVHRVPGRAGWELRLVVQGGLRILDKIAALHFGTIVARPRLRTTDAAVMLWRALQMRAAPGALAGRTA